MIQRIRVQLEEGEKMEGNPRHMGEGTVPPLGLPCDEKKPTGVGHCKPGTSCSGSRDFWAVSLPSESRDSHRVSH